MDKYKDYDKLTNESYIEEGFFKKKRKNNIFSLLERIIIKL